MHQDNRDLATYATADGVPQYETHFALINVTPESATLCAFPSPEIRNMALDSTFNMRRHAQAVTHFDAFQLAAGGAPMWFRQDDGEMVPLVLNRPRGVRALRIARIAGHG